MVLGSKGTELGIENKVPMERGLCCDSLAACACAGYRLISKVFLPLFLASSWEQDYAAEQPCIRQAPAQLSFPQ